MADVFDHVIQSVNWSQDLFSRDKHMSKIKYMWPGFIQEHARQKASVFCVSIMTGHNPLHLIYRGWKIKILEFREQMC